LIERSTEPLAVIVGYGPVGKSVDQILRDDGMRTVVVDLNMDTIQELTKAGRAAIFGDAFNIEVMHSALGPATHIIITLPHSANRDPLIAAAKLINPAVKVFVRARYIREREELEQVGADAACFEEVEAAVALAKLVLGDRGKDADEIRHETIRIRQQLRAESSSLAG
jgi:monovalent cation:H+ antiporter-2, CPA2 family